MRIIFCTSSRGLRTWFKHLATAPAWPLSLTAAKARAKASLRNGSGDSSRPLRAHIQENSHQLVGRFNALLKKAVVVFADEAFFAGDKQAEGAP